MLLRIISISSIVVLGVSVVVVGVPQDQGLRRDQAMQRLFRTAARDLAERSAVRGSRVAWEEDDRIVMAWNVTATHQPIVKANGEPAGSHEVLTPREDGFWLQLEIKDVNQEFVNHASFREADHDHEVVVNRPLTEGNPVVHVYGRFGKTFDRASALATVDQLLDDARQKE